MNSLPENHESSANSGDSATLKSTRVGIRTLSDGSATAYLVSQCPASNTIGLKLKRGTDIADREQRWLVSDFLPDDSLIIVAGQPGLGKTTACMDWAASVTNGHIPITGGKRNAANVLMLSNEDSEAQLRRIFTRLGGDLSRLYVEDEDSDLAWGLGDVPALEAHISDLKPALVIIDSLSSHKPGKVDLNSHGDVAPMLVALRKLAAAHRVAIVVIHHTNKLQTNDPLSKISGSTGIIATARHAILVAQHPEDENIRVAAIAKSNLTRPGARSYKFQLDPFVWDGATDLRAADLLQVSGDNAGSTSDAETFLSDALADGKVDCSALFREGEGYGLNRRAIQRAADKLRVKRERVGFGRGSKICWSLAAIDDTIDDTPPKTVIYGREPMNTALFDAGSTIDDKNHGSVTYVSSMEGQSAPTEVSL